MARSLSILALLSLGVLQAQAAEKNKAPKDPGYIKIEVRGVLRLDDQLKVGAPILANELESQGIQATVDASGIKMILLFGKQKELAGLAKKVAGKTVLVSGELHRVQATPGVGSGLYLPSTCDYIRVTGLKEILEKAP